jgi:hypothetical protein
MLEHRVDTQKAAVESLAAELTNVAYPVLLGGGLGASWVELELGLWKALDGTLQKWLRELPPRSSVDDAASWRKNLVAGLVNTTLFVVKQQGGRKPLPYVESGLQQAFSCAIHRSRPVSERRQVFGANP